VISLAKIKIKILCRDGIVRTYRINRSNLKNYVKVSYSKKEKRWIWIRKERKIKLEKKKRIKKPKKAKEREFREKQKMIKQVWHVKYIYDSPRASYHDLITEIRVTTIRKNPLTEDEMKDLAKDLLEAIEAIESEGLPFVYTKVEVGLEDEEEIEAIEEDTQAELITYSHELS
jgi:hypothetical protein